MYRKENTKRTESKRRIMPGVLLLALLLIAALFALPSLKNQILKSLYPQKYTALVEQYAAEYNVNPLLIYSIIKTESGFDPNATSNVDARGLMQITEETFAWIKLKIAQDEEIVFEDLYLPEVNVRFGAYYLSRCMERYGDVSTAAAAYHSGWGTVDQLLKKPEYALDEHTLKEFPYQQMKLYVYKVDKALTQYTQLYSE